jgi:hypothetical protein
MPKICQSCQGCCLEKPEQETECLWDPWCSWSDLFVL